MITFKDFTNKLDEEVQEPRVKVGDKVTVHFKKMNGDIIERGEHTVVKVGKTGFHVDREGEDGKLMQFKHNGYSKDYGKSYSGRVKGLSRSSGHLIKSLID